MRAVGFADDYIAYVTSTPSQKVIVDAFTREDHIEVKPCPTDGEAPIVVERWSSWTNSLTHEVRCPKCRMYCRGREAWNANCESRAAQRAVVDQVRLPRVFAELVLELMDGCASECIGPDATELEDWIKRTYPELSE
jgi:hypothetical protein